MQRKARLLLLAPLLLTARLAWAEDASTKERAALTACLSGDYAKGVGLLTELFVDSKDPTYLYNQGRCYEQNQRYQDAIARFQEYLRAGRKLSRAERADAQKHIADCKELLANPPVPPPVAIAPAAPPPQPLPPPAAVVVPPPAPAPVLQQSATPPADTSSGWRAAGLVTAAVGGAALVTAVVLNLKVNGMADDLQKTDAYTDDKESDRQTYETLGWVSYGVGAACLATGAALYVLGMRSAAGASPTVALAPLLSPGQAGAVVQGAF